MKSVFKYDVYDKRFYFYFFYSIFFINDNDDN